MAGELTFGSLFAGIGGFDLGFERAGMVCKWQVEIDDYANKLLAKHWPNVHRERDIRECGKHNLEPVDVICGGFPCQDISYAGLGAGLDGERSGLFSRPFAWFANSDRESLCWKMWQRCLLGDWTEFKGRWPRSGLMRNGIAYRLPPLVPRIQETGLSLLPTATAMESYSDLSAAKWSGCAPYVNGIKRNTDLAQYLKHCGREDLATSAEFREWHMGFPQGWTDLEDSETP